MIPKTRLTKEERIEKIIKAATRVMARDGYKEASTKEIAQLAECTEALIFKYFKTKEDILRTIVNKMIEENNLQYSQFLQLDLDIKSMLLKLVEWHQEHYELNKDLFKVVIRFETVDKEFGQYIHRTRVDYRLKPLVLELERRQKLGEIKKSIACEDLGNMLVELLSSIKNKIVFHDLSKDEILFHYRKMIELIVENIIK